MTILMIMMLGVFIGAKYFPGKWHGYNNKVQVSSIILLIFCMGITLGSNPDFMQELGAQGIKGFVFAIVPIFFSVIIVYYLTHKLLKEKENDSGSDR